MSDTKNYYYLDAERKPHGPLSLEELLEMYAAGTLAGDVMTAAVGGEKWRPLRALTPEARSANVGPCPKCGKDVTLVEGDVPELCPACGKRLRPANTGFASAVYSAFAQYATFRGRSTRAEYWWFTLFNFLGSFVLSICSTLTLPDITPETLPHAWQPIGAMLLCYSFSFITLIPSLSLLVRRLHDIGRSGRWLLLPIGLYITLWVSVVPMMLVYDNKQVPEAYQGLVVGFALILFLLSIIALIVVSILFLTWLLTDSQTGSNKYGPSAKYPLPLTPRQ